MGLGEVAVYAGIYIPEIGPTGCVDLLRVAQAFASDVETVAPGLVVFSIAGLRRLMGPPHTIASEIARRAHECGLNGNIGVARTRDLAVLAARSKQGVSVIEPGKELDWLGELKLSTLPLEPETVSLLTLWGIETLSQFCALPEDGLLERLGKEASFLHRLARGEWKRPLATNRPPDTYEQRIVLDHPLDNLEPLLFLLNRLLDEFCSRLDRQTMSVEKLHLRLDLERAEADERHIALPVPVRDAKFLLRLVQARLEAQPPPAPVTAFTLALDPVRPRFLQHDLYEPPRPEPEKLDWTLSKIRGFLGEDRVGTPELLNTHRPDAWRLTSLPNLESAGREPSSPTAWGLAFRYFRPPKRARVETRQEAPVFVAADDVRGEVRERAGPWIKSGDWWMGDAWSRKEWDVVLSTGGVYRIYLSLTAVQWFLEGSYG